MLASAATLPLLALLFAHGFLSKVQAARKAYALPTFCPTKGTGKDIRRRRASPGSDVGVSTCKMAAHHRQNTAGRRKVQVWRPGSAALATPLSGLLPPRAGGCLGPRPAGFDGRRMTGRGAASRGVGPRRQRPEAAAGRAGRTGRPCGPRASGRVEPLSRGTVVPGPRACGGAMGLLPAHLPLLSAAFLRSGRDPAAEATRRPLVGEPRQRGALRGRGGTGPHVGACAGGNDSFPSFAVGFTSPFTVLPVRLPVPVSVASA